MICRKGYADDQICDFGPCPGVPLRGSSHRPHAIRGTIVTGRSGTAQTRQAEYTKTFKERQREPQCTS